MKMPFFNDRHEKLREKLETLRSAGTFEELKGNTEEEQARGYLALLAKEHLLDFASPADGNPASLDTRSLCLIRESLCYSSSLADLMIAMQGLGSFPITLAGSADQKSKLLPHVRQGSAIFAFAITEPEAGSDVSAMQTRANLEGDSYVLNGVKTFISNAGLADFYTVFAKTDPDAGHRGISAFVIERDAPGFVFEEKIELIAPHPIGRIRFENCRVPVSSILGGEGQGFKIALTTLDTFRPTVGAAANGLAWRALDEAVKYSKQRTQFGKSISEFQATQIKIADMATELEASRLLVYKAAWQRDTVGGRTSLESAMAKLYATEAAQRVVDSAVQIHGGSGVVAGNTVEKLYREVRALRIYEGTSEIQRLVIASQILSG